MKKLLALLILLLFTFFSYSLNMKNPDSVTLKYYFGIEAEVDMFLVLLVPFALGMILGVLLMSISVVRNKMQASKAKRQLVKAEREVENLKVAPAAQPMPGSSAQESLDKPS